MGFDNECILNIQSLAGEYFCPVCRLLVYPTEAVQSQCTHLYCKPCLTYVVSTTRACPYDGYLVTEADSKPLIESNKALAETIGKIAVYCLYHRSGCTWQGPLSDCTSHCTGCAFGNSPVVCNRCGVQIVHSQVQEHAQNCSGVPSQAQQTEAGQETAPAGNQTKSGNKVGAPTTVLLQISQTTAATTPAAHDPNVHAQIVHGAGLTPEQLYQQQQYYQQYPGYDPYQQQYQQQLYPYQQHAAQQYHQQPAHAPGHPHPPPQAQAQPQPIAQPQPQGQPQLQVNPPQQLHPAVHPHSQIPPQSHPQSHGNPPPQPQLYPQPQPQPQSYLGQIQPQAYPLPQQALQMPQSQIQQPQPQIHPQQPTPHSVAQSQPYPQPQYQLHASQSNQPPHAQHQSVHAVSGHQSYQQPQPQQQIQLIAPPQQHSMVMHPQSVPNQLPQHAPIQVQTQFPQQPGQMHPPVPNQQQPIIHPAQQVHPHAHQPGHPIPSRPAMHPNQQPMPQQHVQQQHFPFPGQPTAPLQNQLHQQGAVFHHHQQPMQSHLHPQVPSSANPQTHPTTAVSHGTQPFQSQNYVGRPMVPNPSGQSQPFAMQSGAHKQSMPLNNLTRATNQSQTMSEQQLSNSQIGRDNVMNEGGGEVKPSSGIAMKNDAKYVNTSGSIDDSVESKTVKSENDRTQVIVEDVNATSQAGSGINSESNALEKNNHVVQHMGKEEAIEGALEPSAAGKSLGNVGEYQKDQVQRDQQSFKEDEGQGEATILEGGRELRTDPLDNSRNVLPTSGEDKYTKGFPVNNLPEAQVPPVSGQPPYPDQPVHYGHYAPSMLHAGPPGPQHGQRPPNQLRPQGSGYMGQGQPINHPDHMQPFVRGPSGGPFLPPPFDVHGGMMARPPPHGPEEVFMSQRHGYLDGRQLDLQHSGPQTGIRDDRFRTPYPMEPSRRMIDRGEFEDDLKQFPRPSHLDADPKLGGYFSSSRPLDKPPHGLHYDGGLKLDPRNILHPNDARDRLRPSSFHDDNMGRSEFSRGRPDFFGPVSQYGRLHMDGSPIRDYPGMPPHRFNVHSDPMGSIHESRFPPHIRRDDPFLPSHLRLGELPGPGNFPPRFGEPGFRSSYTSQDTGFYKGTMESYDNPRKRKTPSMGWCRICKVDSETMEGLDLHSQTREHQDTAMAMVLKIKQQNAKKKKIISNDHSAAEDASKPKSASIENRRNRH